MKVSLWEKSGSRGSVEDRLAGIALRSVLACVLLFLGMAARPSIAAADSVKTFNIERQTLASALNEFAVQSNRQILFSTDIVRAKQARAIKGQLEPEAALRLLLKGTGLRFRVTSDNTILVEAASGVTPPIYRSRRIPCDWCRVAAHRVTRAPLRRACPRIVPAAKPWGRSR